MEGPGGAEAVRRRQHLRHGGRGPPHAVPEPRRQHAPGAAQRLLPRLHRYPHRQEGPQHAAHLRPLHRHLHHRAGGPGRGDGAHLLREPAPGAAHHRADHRPGLRPHLRRPRRGRTRRHQAALRHRAGHRRRPAPHRGDLPGPHRSLHPVHRPQRIQGPGGRDEPPRRGHLQGDAGPAERARVGPHHVRRPQRRGATRAPAPAQGRAGPAHRTVQGPRRPARHPGGVRHAAHRVRRAHRAGDVPRCAAEGAHPAPGHRPREPAVRGGEDLRAGGGLLGRVREAQGRARDLLHHRCPGGVDAERGRAAAAPGPARGGDAVLQRGGRPGGPERLRSGAGARGRAGRVRPRVPAVQPVDGHAAAGPACARLSRRPALARQDPRRGPRPLPGRPARSVGLRGEGPEADCGRGRRGRRPDTGQGGPALLAGVRGEGRGAQDRRGEGERDGARHPPRDQRAPGGEPGLLPVAARATGGDHRGAAPGAPGFTCPRRPENGRRPKSGRKSSPGSGAARPSGCRKGWRRGARRPASRCPG